MTQGTPRRTSCIPVGRAIDQFASPEPDPEPYWKNELLQKRAVRELRLLPELERVVLRLRFGFGGDPLSFRQIARRLGLSVSGTHAIYGRGVKRLGAAMLVGHASPSAIADKGKAA